MRRWGFTAAALLLLLLGPAAIVKARAQPLEQQLAHSCTAADSDFLNDARSALETFRLDDAQPQYAIVDAQTAVTALRRTSPSDPSLRQARLLLSAMLVEYASSNTHRYFILRDEARDTLSNASTPLRKLGCEVDALL